MKTLGNFVWFIFCGGLFSSLAWILFGTLMALTIVGLPFAFAAFRIAAFAAFPFGKQLVDARNVGEERIMGTSIVNFAWFLLAGLWLAIAHLLAAIGCVLSCVTIVPILLGAPAWAFAHLRLASVSLAPLGKRVVITEVAQEVHRRQSRAYLDGSI